MSDHALDSARVALSRAEAHECEAPIDGYPLVLAQVATAAATLALAEQQRVANLIAVTGARFYDGEEESVAVREISDRLGLTKTKVGGVSEDGASLYGGAGAVRIETPAGGDV